MIDGIGHEHSPPADSCHRRARGDCRLQDLVRLDYFHPTCCSLVTKSRYIQMLSCFYIPQFYVSLCTFNTHSTLSYSFLSPSLLPINPLGHGNNVRAVIRREREIGKERSTRGNKKYTMRPIKGDLVFIRSCV